MLLVIDDRRLVMAPVPVLLVVLLNLTLIPLMLPVRPGRFLILRHPPE